MTEEEFKLARNADIAELWRNGETVRVIAEKLSAKYERRITKNMISGYVHRLGFEGRPSPIKAPKPKAPKIAKPVKIAKKPAPQRSRPLSQWPPRKSDKDAPRPRPQFFNLNTIPTPNAKPMAALKYADCRWPVDNPSGGELLYCAEASHPGRAYCEAHCRVAFTNFKTQEEQ